MEKSVSQRLAEWVYNLRYEDLPEAVIVAVKRILLDTLACGMGGHHSHDAGLAGKVILGMGGKPEATILGSSQRTNAYNAALLNAIQVRSMDYNDIYWKEDPSHPSDIIPAGTAMGERQGKSGKDLLVAIAIGHEVEMRLCEFAHPGIRERGWHHATLTAFVSPLVAGKMLGLNVDQLTHAQAIAACHSFTLGAVAAGKLSMMKNTCDPLSTHKGVMAALLAEQGYTGTIQIYEGKEGLYQELGGDFETELLFEGLGQNWRVPDISFKAFPTEFLTQSPVTAALKLVKEKNVKWEEIEEVKVFTIHRAVDILADPTKYHPKEKETADHSMPYCVGAAIMDRMVTPLQFLPERIADQKLIDFIQKIKVLADDELEAQFPKLQPSRVEFRMKSGETLTQSVDYAKGDPREPMTEEDLMDKFYGLTKPYTSDEHRARIAADIKTLEKFDRIETFVASLAM
ncbi:MAG: MmgE/PrpD family protein [bacterium]